MTKADYRCSAAILFFFVLFATHDVVGQDLGGLLDRLDRLERDISTLNVRLSGGKLPPDIAAKPVGEPLPKYAGARLTARLDSLEQELRNSTGGQEAINHKVQLLMDRIDKLVGDIDFRLSAIENKLLKSPTLPGQTSPGNLAGVPAAKLVTKAPISGPLPGTLGTISKSVVKQGKKTRSQGKGPAPILESERKMSRISVLPDGTPKEQYTYAFNLLRQTNYDQAEIALKQFIETHSGNPLAGNARYWLGETYYVRTDYQKAAQVFFEAFQSNPKANKAPDMLLKLGMSLARLGKKNEACATYNKVQSDFANSIPRIKTALARQRKQSGC
ncbi:MAG: tol-pal system protein YbgF [Magnetovibrio sp.]|nr:tol-pal system protein YbgF [Magnetovibrio sp.]|tara:strand:+ start:599 stop:1588 length:990 start_codon:yes stop_codon:yes gene_type:complete